MHYDTGTEGTSVQKEKVHCNVTCNFYSNKSYNLTSEGGGARKSVRTPSSNIVEF